MHIDADLHLHSHHSGGVSDKMTIPTMAEQASIKGLDLVGTGDILNPAWRNHVEETTTQTAEGIYEHDDTAFLPTTEVEDTNRVHHIIFFPSLDAADAVHRSFASASKDITTEGRPHLDMTGAEIVEAAKQHDCLVGPAHAFTPWTSIYKEHDTLEDCYDTQKRQIDFLELGLSADTQMADQITEHNDITFLSNSDAHSPWPHRLGREFNRFDIQEITFDELKHALHRNKGRSVIHNVGFDPREGKYHCSACQDCHQRYSLDQAKETDWTCRDCGKSIKKGVKDRVTELADGRTAPDWRPDYTHLVPLAEIIKENVGHASVTTKTVQRIYDSFLDTYNSEIDILLDTPETELNEINPSIASAIMAFRNDMTIMIPGGGGDYGELIIPNSEEDYKRIRKQREADLQCRYDNTQKSLGDF